MTMTDPIADMLTRLRNANVAHHDTVRMPSSKVKEALAAILVREGYITSFKVTSDEKRPGSFLEVTMKYAADRTRTISGVRGFVSTLGPTRCRASLAAWALPYCLLVRAS
jgi:small subunit ribosomal protein S8